MGEWEHATFQYYFINVSKHDFDLDDPLDSMNVELLIENNSGIHRSDRIRIKAPVARDSAVINWVISSNGLGGLNSLSATASNQATFEHQLFNNRLKLNNYLNVIQDSQRPVLDVTVDGRYLVNGDVVSPNPNVKVALKDESAIYFKTDTVGIEIQFKNLDTNTQMRVNFS